MMRITNSMMSQNTKTNINLNKTEYDRKNTVVATGQKISRPSEDPVIAIRALRMNTNLTQLNQYYEKNIPDANAWMEVTETALLQTNEIYAQIKENLTGGASDDNTANDRSKILENLKGLRDQIYASGNADYAGRTVFTGYRTGETLTFLKSQSNQKYNITEPFAAEDIKNLEYVSGSESGDITLVEKENVTRVRLAYGDLTIPQDGTPTITMVKDYEGAAPTTSTYAVTTKSIFGKTPSEIDDIYTNVGDDEVVLIPETGELILGTNVSDDLKTATIKDKITFDYTKTNFEKGDLRPEHYFACKVTEGTKETLYNYNKDVDPAVPDFHNQSIEVEVSFNQKVPINTHASDVFMHGIGREVDELIKTIEDVIASEQRLSSIKSQYNSGTSSVTKDELDAAQKEYDLKKEISQKRFSKALTEFDGYFDRNNLAISNIGSMSNRLTITKERVADQIKNFTSLASDNINAELTDSSIDLKNAQVALQAAQLAAGKISEQTLLNYI